MAVATPYTPLPSTPEGYASGGYYITGTNPYYYDPNVNTVRYDIPVKTVTYRRAGPNNDFDQTIEMPISLDGTIHVTPEAMEMLLKELGFEPTSVVVSPQTGSRTGQYTIGNLVVSVT